MSIIKMINKMMGHESEAEKLYKILNTDEYKERPYEYSDLGEGMAVIGETMWGWWKHRFLINHNTKRAYEFMDKDQNLVTVTQDDIDWESLKNLPEDAQNTAKALSFHFPSFIRHFENRVAQVSWQLNPDGRYYMDGDGYGMTDDEEVEIYGFIDTEGKNIVLFFIVSLCICTFVNCNNTDYTKEEKYLEEVYLKDRYNKTDTTKIITIVKAEKTRLYNPKLDENKQRMILFGKTSFQKYVDALDAHESGKVSDDVVFKDMKKIFTSIESNSDGLIVMFKMKNADGYFFDILFSNDDVYYATLMTDVGMYLSKQVYNYEINEAREELKDALKR